MKSFYGIILLALCNTATSASRMTGREDFVGVGFGAGARCVNVWDEGCVNGQLDGAGRDDDFVNGGGLNPGKRCAGRACAPPRQLPFDENLNDNYLATRPRLRDALLAKLVNAHNR